MLNPDDYIKVEPTGEQFVGVCLVPSCDKPRMKPAASEKDARNRVSQHILRWHA